MTAITFRRVLARCINSLGDGITQGKTRYFRTDIWPLNFSCHGFQDCILLLLLHRYSTERRIVQQRLTEINI